MKDLQRTNDVLTLITKTLIISLLVGVIISGNTAYDMFAHKGVDCKTVEMEHWLKNNYKDSSLKIISIHKDRLQKVNGTTICRGVATNESGAILDWKGSISKTDIGYVGWASVVE